MNFGTVKDIFTLKLIESYSSEDDVLIEYGKDLYKKFLNTIKESKTLKTAFIVFKNIETKTLSSEISANEYLKESIKLFKNKKSLTKEINKLTNLLESNGIDYKDSKTTKLHIDIQNLITSPTNVGTLQKLQEAREDVVSWLISEKETIELEENYINKNVNPKKFLEIATNKFNEKYKDSLTEEEKNILKVLRENDQKKVKILVSGLVKENVSLVNRYLEENTDNITIKSKLLETKDAIYKIAEDDKSFSTNVLKLYELKKNIEKC